MNLVEHLAARATKHPDRIALVDASQSMSYVELYSHVCGASKELSRQGLKSGDTVLIFQPVGIPLYISLLATFHAGMTAMLIDPSSGKIAMQNSLSLHPPQAFIGIAKAHLLRLTLPEFRQIPHHFNSTGCIPLSKKWRPQPTELFSPTETPADTPALITFTSGSTGMPKAACRTHGFLLAQHKALAESLDYKEGDVDLVTLPVFTLANLASGLTSVLADTDLRFPAKPNASAIAKQCREYRVTRCAASPAFFTQLHREKMLPDFKTIYTGGAPVFPQKLDEITISYPEMNLITVFGSTEAEPIAHIAWNDVTEKQRQAMLSGEGLLVGKPVKATELLIIRDQTGQAIDTMTEEALSTHTLPSGEAGEIIVTGDHVLKGYLGGKGDTENKIHVGNQTWHRTGDAAKQDDNGNVWLLGRCSAAIHQEKKPTIYPFSVECVAMSHPNVERCALVLHREKVTLFVEGVGNNNTCENILTLLKNHFVEEVLFISHIPVDKRHNAKIDYVALRELIQ